MRTLRKPALLAGCALSALLATLPTHARAQSFAGTDTVVTGNASVFHDPTGGPGGVPSTEITISDPEVVINWSVVGGAPGVDIVFQPANTYALFQGDDLADYTVLNRILPNTGGGSPTPLASRVRFDGTVESMTDPGAGAAVRGGQVWFYSPTGIIVGPTATFNVGSLILTTNDIGFIPDDPLSGTSGSIRGPGGLVTFNGPVGSTGSVDVQFGAQLNAEGNVLAGATAAYVALVAPRVIQGGRVSADGNIAYLAAEQVDMTINAGLFDFVLTVGTTDPEGVNHTGTTTGPASTSATDLQRIALVALPKNDALTMMLAGSVGYAPAASAANEGSSVVLAAGFDGPAPVADPGNRLGNISIERATTFRNALTGFASNAVTISPVIGAVDFEAVSTFHALNAINLVTDFEQQINAASDLVLNAGTPGVGGDVLVDAHDGGSISVARQFRINARPAAFYGAATGDATGGTVTITASDGSIFAFDALVDASATAGSGGALGGMAAGGTVDVDLSAGGLLDVDNIASFDVSGTGGNSPDTGGLGQGGRFELTAGGGTVSLGSPIADAGGFGGAGDIVGGNGTGGPLAVTGTGGVLDFGTVALAARGQGGTSAGDAGDGFGGIVDVTILSGAQDWDQFEVSTDAVAGGQLALGTGLSGSATADPKGIGIAIEGPGSLTVRGDMIMTANAQMEIDGQSGFTGRAGGIELTVGPGGQLTVEGTLAAQANAQFAAGVDDSPDSSPTQVGGSVAITASGGVMLLNNVDASANAETYSGVTAAGTATGGSIRFSSLNSGSIALTNALGTASLTLAADAYGSPGPLPGVATGGRVDLIADDGAILVDANVTLSANALIGEFFAPPPVGDGFAANGGTVAIDVRPGLLGTAFINTGSTFASAVGDSRMFEAVGTLLPGGDPIQGNGGDGTGGTVSLTLGGSAFQANTLRLDSSGTGGASAATTGPTPFQAGSGFGGESTLVQNGGSFSVVVLDLLSNGQGGGTNLSASGVQRAALAGHGTGGTATLTQADGDLPISDVTLRANGIGGEGMRHNGSGNATDGGDGFGGLAQLQAAAGWTGSITSNTLILEAKGTGGVGGRAAGASAVPPTAVSGRGGDGIAGSALIDLADGAFSLGNVTLDVTGLGGNSGDASTGLPAGADGGIGFGGIARFALIDSAAGPVGGRRAASISADAGGRGGIGSLG
ncbi:MAG TPA: hypothetical protein VI168_14295, partial [Croceibacterium sp.]